MVFILDERARGAMVRCRDTQSTREGRARGERTNWISCLKATNRNRNRNRTQEKNRGQGGRLGIPVRGGGGSGTLVLFLSLVALGNYCRLVCD